MSARFTTNLVVLLAGAGLLVIDFAFALPTTGWVSVGAGATAAVVALANFALANQGVYQRVADVLITTVGAWAIVIALVLAHNTRWLEFGAGAGLAGLGTLGLIVRELRLNRGMVIGDHRIRTDQFAQIAKLQHKAGVRR